MQGTGTAVVSTASGLVECRSSGVAAPASNTPVRKKKNSLLGSLVFIFIVVSCTNGYFLYMLLTALCHLTSCNEYLNGCHCDMSTRNNRWSIILLCGKGATCVAPGIMKRLVIKTGRCRMVPDGILRSRQLLLAFCFLIDFGSCISMRGMRTSFLSWSRPHKVEILQFVLNSRRRDCVVQFWFTFLFYFFKRSLLKILC